MYIVLKVIPISDKEHNHEKEVEERLKREITEEFLKKKLGLRRKIALILSSIGGIIYLLEGIMFCGVMFFTSSTDSLMFLISISYLIIGEISLMGTRIAAKKIKLGGRAILISIPISIFITLVTFNFYTLNSIYLFYAIVYIILPMMPIPFPTSVFVIIGGIMLLLSSDKESSELENSVKIAV